MRLPTSFFANIRFRDVDGGVRNAFVPLADLDNRRILAKTLQNLGAYFSGKHQVNEDALGKLVASKHKAKRLNFAARVGWYDGYRAFVLPNRVIGASRSDVRIRPPRLNSPGHAAGLGRLRAQRAPA